MPDPAPEEPMTFTEKRIAGLREALKGDGFMLSCVDGRFLLSTIDTIRSSLAKVEGERDEARGARNQAEVYAFLSEASGPDTGPPTMEMAAAIWELIRDPEDSMLTLAVKAWERGKGFAEQKSRALSAESEVSRLRGLLGECRAFGGWSKEFTAKLDEALSGKGGAK